MYYEFILYLVLYSMEQSENLSEILFKPKFVYPETSVISNSGAPMPTLSRDDISFGFEKNFYRSIIKFDWVYCGGNALDIDEALAKICVSTAPRNRDGLYDTVKEYGNGHWNYEFNCIAQKRVVKAHECENSGDIKGASHNYRLAARYFAIAAYPFLKSDTLAVNSDVLGRISYKKMYDVDPDNGILKEMFFDVDGKKVTGYLHLPDLKEVYPCVVIVCSYEATISSFYRFVNDYLAKAKIAAFIIEMPGAMGSDKLDLADHFSLIVENAVDFLSTQNSIDSTNIGLVGYGMSATSCLRASIMQPNKIKAQAVLAPYVHSFFTDKEILNSLPLCLRSSICNRLDLDASNWDFVIPRLRPFSLKEQGLLSSSSKNKVPTLVAVVQDSVVTKDDLTLLKNNFSEITINCREKVGFSEFIRKSIDEVTKFFVDKFKN